jgi:hypothetical protein
MISSELYKTITERITELPDYIQESLAAVPWLDTLNDIAAKYRLNEQQMASFVTETAMVLLEVLPAQLYKTNLINHVVVSGEIADQIIRDVRERIIDRLQAEQTRIVGNDPQLFMQALQSAGVDTDDVPLAPQMVQDAIAGSQAGVSSAAVSLQGGDKAALASSHAVSGHDASGDPYRESIE